MSRARANRCVADIQRLASHRAPGRLLEVNGMRGVKKLVVMCGCVVLAASCGVPANDDYAGDEEVANTDQAATGGISENSPEAKGVLRVANTATSSQLVSKAGINQAAANGISYYRLGDDQLVGTSDDERFDTLAELDAVPYVGPSEFLKLLTYAKTLGYVASAPPDAGSTTPTTPTTPKAGMIDFCGDGLDQDGVGGDRVCGAGTSGGQPSDTRSVTLTGNSSLYASPAKVRFSAGSQPQLLIRNSSSYTVNFAGTRTTMGSGWLNPGDSLTVRAMTPEQVRFWVSGSLETYVTLETDPGPAPTTMMEARLKGTATNKGVAYPAELVLTPYRYPDCTTRSTPAFYGSINDCVGRADCWMDDVQVDLYVNGQLYGHYLPNQCWVSSQHVGQSPPAYQRVRFMWSSTISTSMPRQISLSAGQANRNVTLGLSGSPAGLTGSVRSDVSPMQYDLDLKFVPSQH